MCRGRLCPKAASKGGTIKILQGAASRDANRTREIRAMDIVLVQPRMGARLEFIPGHPLIAPAATQISPVYLSEYVTLHNGRARLRAMPKYRPPGDNTLQSTFGILLNGGDPQFDELLMATVWMVSPPDAGEEAEPDESWEPHVQHFVFWNLNHAPRVLPPENPGEQNITLQVPLAFGAASPLLNGFLSIFNGMFNEASAFFRSAADLRGRFWNT